MNNKSVIIFALIFLAANLRAATVIELQCEYGTDPLGIDSRQPRLSWGLRSEKRGDVQTAYQLLVASSPELLAKDTGDIWDSGKVSSDQNLYVAYAGQALLSNSSYFWKVRVWDKSAAASDWSPAARWTTGLLEPGDWSAKWISAAKWFVPPALRPPGLVVGAGGWADVDLGTPVAIEQIRLYPHSVETFPARFTVEGSDEPQFYQPRILVDQSAVDFRIHAPGMQQFSVSSTPARYVRLKILKPQDKQKNAIVRQMEIMSGGKNVALMRPTHEFGTAWHAGHAVFLVDGMPSEGQTEACPENACSITQAPLLRKSFVLKREVKRATLFSAAMGMADITINGQRVGDEVDAPPFTDYTKRVVYLTHDITPLLVRGENVIGATLGNGFFSTPGRGFGERHSGHGPPRFLAQAQIEFTDGTRETIATDDTWKWARSEITLNDIWQGYAEDRRLAKPGWDRPGYADNDWQPVALAASLGGTMHAPTGPAIRVAGELKPMRVENNWAFFNALTAGWPRLKISGKAGQTITITGHCRDYSLPKLTFVLASDGPAVLEPRFLYLSGPLDVQVEGLSQPLTPESISIQIVHADLKSAGAFECSNSYLNTLHDSLMRTHLNYNGDQPMDPMREKQGWTQDAQNMFDSAAYLTDVRSFYRKWWWDFADGQEESGYLGSVVPVVGRRILDWNSPWWSGVIVYLPWEHYIYYGDRRMLEDAYEPMRRYVDFLGSLASSGAGRGWGDYPYLNVNLDTNAAREKMIIWNGAGDWLNPYTAGQNAVPTPMTTMPAWYYYATIVSKTAAILGKNGDADKYAAIALDVKNRFNAKYFHPDTGLYGDAADNQTAQVLPLALGLVPEDKRELAYQRLIDAIHARKDHIGCGFVALPFLLQTLCDNRETALANKMVNQKSYPSWKTLLHDGVFAESWNGGGAQMPSCGGAIGMWLYQSVLGIRADVQHPGFKNIILCPQPDPATGLTWAKGSYDSIQGRVTSEWKCESGKFTLTAGVPVNTTATIYIPTKDPESVTESGGTAKKATGAKFLRVDGAFAVFEVGGGIYHFAAAYDTPPQPASDLIGKDFADDFSNGSDNWDQGLGSWKVAGGRYVQSRTDVDAVTGIKRRQWRDATYTFICSIENDGGSPTNWAGFQFRKDDVTADHAGAGYLVYLRANGELNLFANGAVLQSAKTGVDAAKPVRIRIVTAGPEINVYINDEAQPRLAVRDDTFHDGYAGFESFHVKAAYGKLSVHMAATRRQGRLVR